MLIFSSTNIIPMCYDQIIPAAFSSLLVMFFTIHADCVHACVHTYVGGSGCICVYVCV